jgi:Predicted ribosomal protein
MIKIIINKKSILIDGHANYDDFGKDIVCASATSIATTTINAILRLDKNAVKYTSESGQIKIDILKNNKMVNILIENMIELFKELEKKYKKNIKIEEVSL